MLRLPSGLFLYAREYRLCLAYDARVFDQGSAFFGVLAGICRAWMVLPNIGFNVGT